MLRSRIVLPFLLSVLAPLGAGAAAALSDPSAVVQPVVLTGDRLPDFLGMPAHTIWAYRYDSISAGFVQVPLQVDERLPIDLTQGQSGGPVYELTYDWAGAEDGTLDADDEIVFMARDLGERAPDTDVWVGGADPLRVEVRVDDPLTGQSGWLYLFTSATLSDDAPSFSYVGYSAPDPTSGVADVDTAVYHIGYDGRWRLTTLEILPGSDLLDRIKARAYAVVGSETEETFENTSQMLGAYAGKVRALREVQGAASGPLTTHVDVFYRDTWRRTSNLRVHAISHVWSYYDYVAPPAPGRYYSSNETSGLPIDGANDLPSSLVPPAWGQVSLPQGTLVLYFRELTPFPYPDPSVACFPTAGSEFYWRDDASFDDLSGDDGSAYGNHGVHLRCLADTNASPYSTSLTHYLLPPQDPYHSVGATYAQREETPLLANTESQPRQALTDARLDSVVRAGGGRLTLSWTDALGEDRYEIYRGELLTPFAYDYDTPLACDLPAQTTSWTSSDDQESGQPSYEYLVVPAQGGERRYGTDGDGTPRPPSASSCP